MQSLVKKLKLKRVVAMLLLVCTVMSTFLTSFNNIGVVKANSTDLRKTYIQMMSGRNVSQISGISNLTTDDLRCLAIYLSNFYVPFSTTLDADSEDDNKKTMIDALTLLGIKKDVAEPMVSGIYSASLSSAQKLYVKESDLWDISGEKPDGWIGWGDSKPRFHWTFNTFDNDRYKKLVGDPINIGSDYYTPLTAGLWQAICRCLGDAGEAGIASTTGGKNSCSLYYIDTSNNAKECFNLNYSTMTLLAKYLDASKIDTNGKAMNALLNMKGYNSWDKLNDNEKGKLTLFFENIYVDWVGNIIYDAGDQRIVIYPACMNPYVWTAIEGESDSQYKRFNALSTWGIWLINNSKSHKGCGYTKTDDIKGDVYKDDNQVINLYGRHYESSIKQFRGSSETANFDSVTGFWDTGKAGDIGDWIKSDGVFDYGGNDTLGGGNSTCYWGSPGTIRGSFDFTRFLKYDASKTMDTTSNSQFIEGNLVDKAYEDMFFTTSSKFATGEDLNSFMSFGSTDKEMLSNIFLTYAFCYANKDETAFDKTKNYINFKFNEGVFPKVDSSAIEWGDISTTNDQVLSFVYYLLHPVEGAKYVATLIKSKFTGLFISAHEDMVGGTDSKVSTGMTRYLGFSGYATSPSLSDVSWLDSLLKFYDSIIVYFIIFMCVLLLCYVLTGQLTLQRGIIGVVIFGLLAFMPPLAINTTVDITNKVASQLYSNKFEYWALVQMQEYLGKLKDLELAKGTGNTNDYIAKLMTVETNSVASSISYTGTKLKWMTPKKYNDLNEVKNEIDNSNVGDTFSSAFTNLMVNSIANSTSTEDYSESVGKTYLYRDMCDIYLYGMKSYHMYNDFWSESDSLLKYDSARISSAINDTATSNKTNFIGELTGTKNLANSFEDIETCNKNLYWYLAVNEPKLFSTITSDAGSAIADTSSLNAINRGFLYDTVDIKNNGTNINYLTTKTLATTYLASYRNTYTTIANNLSKLKNIVDGSATVDVNSSNISSGNILFGLEADTFNMSINDIQNGGSSLNTLSTENLDKLSGYYYSLYCESPYYFFNWNIRDQYKASGLDHFDRNDLTKQGDEGKIFSKLLLRNNQEYFFNLAENSGDGYGELRDFMNFHDLFYYVIPALKNGNDLVDMFDQLFGMYTYDDCSLTLSADGKWHYNNQEFNNASDFVTSAVDEFDIDGDGYKDEKIWDAMTEEQRYKFWHDYNVWTLFNNYVTWLDTMQDCDYAKSETIRVMGDKFVVSNPLDPTSYYQTDDKGNMTAGRYMVFSESEMKYYGLSTADLTTVERKIIAVQKSVYNTSLDLMNYYTLSDETLINAFSLMELFEFNKEFSQESVIGSDYVLYPQGYELKAFTYDAYLRLIVSEASGESLMGDTDETSSIYQRVAKNTSLFFGIFLVFNDLVAVYVVPMLKLFIICLLFLTSLLIIIGAAVKLEFNFFSVLWKSLLAPLMSYGLLSLGLALIVSMFMSNGAEGVVSSTPVINLGDPTMALICMLVLNVFVTFMYFKIVKKCIKDFKTYFSAVANSVGSAVTGLVGGVTGGLLSKKDKGASKVASTAEQRGRDNNPRTGKAGIGSALAAGAGLGLGADMLSENERNELNTANKRKDNMRTMNKYDRKAYEGATKREDKKQLKAEKAERKLNVAMENGASEKKIARLQKAYETKSKRAENAKNNAEDIRKYGKVGAMKRHTKENIKTAGGRIKSGTLTAVNGGVASAIGAGGAKARNVVDATGRGLKRTVGAPVRAYKTAKKGITTAVNTASTEIYYNGGIRGTVDKYSNTAKSFVVKKARLVGASAKKQLARQNDAMHMGYTFNRK